MGNVRVFEPSLASRIVGWVGVFGCIKSILVEYIGDGVYDLVIQYSLRLYSFGHNCYFRVVVHHRV